MRIYEITKQIERNDDREILQYLSGKVGEYLLISNWRSEKYVPAFATKLKYIGNVGYKGVSWKVVSKEDLIQMLERYSNSLKERHKASIKVIAKVKWDIKLD